MRAPARQNQGSTFLNKPHQWSRTLKVYPQLHPLHPLTQTQTPSLQDPPTKMRPLEAHYPQLNHRFHPGPHLPVQQWQPALLLKKHQLITHPLPHRPLLNRFVYFWLCSILKIYIIYYFPQISNRGNCSLGQFKSAKLEGQRIHYKCHPLPLFHRSPLSYNSMNNCHVEYFNI